MRITAMALTVVAALAVSPVAGASHTGSIAGRVTHPDGYGLNACVDAYGHESEPFASVETDTDGRYVIDRLAPGDYRVHFRPCWSWDPALLDEWYPDAPSIGTAEPVAVTGGSLTSGINARLDLGGSISGRVTDGGDPVDGVCASAYPVSGGTVRTVEVAWWEHGRYTIHGLRTGDHHVRFENCSYGESYVEEWYDDAATRDTAAAVAVVQGLDTPGVDAVLAAAADPAVAGIRVERVPLEAAGAVVGDAPTTRRVVVEIANLGGTTPSTGSVLLEACPITRGGCRSLGYKDFTVAPGGTGSLSFHWDCTGLVGDVDVIATVWSNADAEASNNEARTRYGFFVGGSGVGADLRQG